MSDESKTTEVMSDTEIRSEEVRKRIRDIRSNIEGSYIELAQLLYEAYENDFFKRWGYDSFRDYCIEEMDIKYRRARYFITIAHAVKECGLDWNEVHSIGIAKMRVIAPLLTTGNHKHWMDQAKECTQDQLKAITKNTKKGDDAVVEDLPKLFSVQLRMDEDQHSIIMDTINHAKNVLNTDSMVVALEHIAYEYMQKGGNSPRKTDLATLLGYIERTYAVTLEPAEGQDMGALTEAMAEGEEETES